jgi:hypothetical protein
LDRRDRERSSQSHPVSAWTYSVVEMYLVFTGLARDYAAGVSPMSTSPLSPQEIRAAAEAHKELGPEYSDAVVASFLDRVDREIAARVDARVDARLGPASRAQPVQQAQPNGRRMLLTGVAIGIFVTGVPSLLVAQSAGGVIPKDETSVLLVLAILWAIAVAVGAFAYRAVTTAARNTAFANRTAGSLRPPPES